MFSRSQKNLGLIWQVVFKLDSFCKQAISKLLLAYSFGKHLSLVKIWSAFPLCVIFMKFWSSFLILYCIKEIIYVKTYSKGTNNGIKTKEKHVQFTQMLVLKNVFFFVYIELKISYKQFLIFLNFMNSFLTFLKLKEWLYKTIAHACEKMRASDLAIKVFMIKLTLRQSIYTFLHF